MTGISVVPHAATTMTANAIARYLVNIAGSLSLHVVLIAARPRNSSSLCIMTNLQELKHPSDAHDIHSSSGIMPVEKSFFARFII